VSIVDSSRKTLSTSAKKFFVYNESLGVDTTLALAATGTGSSIFDYMSEGDLDQEFAWSRYERTDQEESQYEALSGVDSKRRFLTEFWGRRPPGLREEYLSRVSYANAQLRVIGREGYRTDRGRVFIVYGPPDDYDRHPNEPGARPYEQWTYHDIQGGVIFVFVQRVSGGQYELVHSTHRNELHDDLWYQHYAQTAR
jgi:GWxTD domain-containing protein